MSQAPVIVIPARNEIGTVASIVESAARAVSAALVIVVDDQSCDSTASAAREAGALVVTTPPHRAGLGTAMRLGIQTGRAMGFDTFLTIDADGQYHPADLCRLLNLFRSSGADLVVGDRLVEGRPLSMRRSRYLANQSFSRLFSLAIHAEERIDSQSGMRVFGGRVADTCRVTNPFTYTQEQLLRARLQGLRVVSTPVAFAGRRYGESRLVTSTAHYAASTVPHLMHVYLRHRLGYAQRQKGALHLSATVDLA